MNRGVESRCATEGMAAVLMALSLSSLALAAQASDAAPPGTASHKVARSPRRSAAEPSMELQEVIVTAERRKEPLQRVPVAVTVFTPAEMESKHIETAQDLGQYVPSMGVYSFGALRDGTDYAIRGQSTTIAAGTAVVVYQDYVPLAVNEVTQSNGGGPGLYLDLDNVQVLNGPQGTLFGVNTTGGAVLLQSKKPDNNLEGYVQAGYGNYDDQQYQAVVNVPVVDHKLLLRVAAERQTRDGFTLNLFNGQHLDNRYDEAIRVTLSFKPTDNFDNDLLYYADESKSNGTGRSITNLNPAPTIEVSASPLILVPLSAFFPGIDSAFFQQQARGPRTVDLDSPTAEFSGYWMAMDTATWTVTHALVVKNIASYQVSRATVGGDTDGSPFPIVSNDNTGKAASLTEELQLQGESLDDNLKWTVGGFYDHLYPLAPQIIEAGLFGTETESNYSQSSSLSKALYAQGTYDLGGLTAALEKFALTAGYRYTWDSRSGFNQTILDGMLCANASLVPPCTRYAAGSDSAGTWTLGLDYQVDPSTFVYAKGSRGFKSGGFSFTALDPNKLMFAPESVLSEEIGLKKDWSFDRVKLRTDIDIFNTTYDDIQRPSFDVYTCPGCTTGSLETYTANVAGAAIKGVEFAGTLVPIRDLALSATYSYLDAYYTKSTNPVAFPVALPFEYTPRNKASVTATYWVPFVKSLGDVGFSASYAYSSRLFAANDIEPGAYLSSYALLNFGANWNDVIGSPVDLRFFMTNATNRTYRIANEPVYYALGFSSAVFGEPRMFGFQVTYHWGRVPGSSNSWQ